MDRTCCPDPRELLRYETLMKNIPKVAGVGRPDPNHRRDPRRICNITYFENGNDKHINEWRTERKRVVP